MCVITEKSDAALEAFLACARNERGPRTASEFWETVATGPKTDSILEKDGVKFYCPFPDSINCLHRYTRSPVGQVPLVDLSGCLVYIPRSEMSDYGQRGHKVTWKYVYACRKPSEK